MKKFFLKILIFLFSFSISLLIISIIFKPIFKAEHLIFPFAIHPFDIVTVYPNTWLLIKKYYYISFAFSYIIIFLRVSHIFLNSNINFTSKTQFKKSVPTTNTDLKLLVGTSENQPIYISENGLYQNILITGTIGTGKTSSAMYPFTEQLISYNHNNQNEKLSMLILDVKGNYYKKVIEYTNNYNRLQDLIIIDLSGKYKYNPLDKPNLKASVLANRLKTILTLFSPNNSESYWLDKTEQVLAESIKFCRLYNDYYVTFSEIHKLIMFPNYYSEKLSILKKMFQDGKFSESETYDLLSCINFFEKEFFSLDNRTLSILKSEISRITNIFVSDYSISKVFCPSKKEINFHGFEDVLKTGKIIVLNMNISEYRNLSKIIASYLKLDFQTEIMNRLKDTKTLRKSAFISDEFHEYITTTDSDFLSQSREAKCINIVATQSYSSIKNALKDENSSKVILQNLINKFWFRTDDIYTIEEIQKQIGKEEKQKISTTLSENAKETKINLLTNNLISTGSNISESYNKYSQNDYIYDTNYFSQKLETFKCLAFISDGFKILKPLELNMIPYFKNDTKIN